ncbi:MAG: hypothetical protein KF866_07005 [Phycisphaeraceae bacterium]|nr:hypothetical protein [Phycisphaeraceae bacterium]MCW5755406.1 hypothetical protein [Phycisphaeraceae bacterium]
MQLPPLEPLVVNADKAPLAPKAQRTFRERLNKAGETVLFAPWRTPRRRMLSGSILGAVIVSASIATYFIMRPMSRPDYEKDRLDRIFKYTLLTDQFNRMPVDQRLELIGQLYQRLKDMDGSESLLLAGFASSVKGEARKQMMENVSRLMIDTADMFAIEYQKITEAERARFLEDALVRMYELGRTFEGRTVTRPRAEIIAEARQNALRDQERMRENPLSTRQSMRMFNFLNDGLGGNATPQQKGRIGSMMLDMTRHLRGQDVHSGKPSRGGGG